MRQAISVGALLAALSLLVTFEAQADDTRAIKGKCGPESHIAEGAIGEDLTTNRSRVFCDVAIATVFSDSPKYVMFQFADSQSHHARQIGYAGIMEDDQIMSVRDVYLEEGRPTPVVEGFCKLFFDTKAIEKTISGIACGAKIDEGQRRTVPVIVFNAAAATRSTPPRAPSSGISQSPYGKSGVVNCSLPGTIINFVLDGQGGAQITRIESNYPPFRSAARQAHTWRAGLVDKDGAHILVLDNGHNTRIMVTLPEGKGTAFSAAGGVSDILCQILVSP